MTELKDQPIDLEKLLNEKITVHLKNNQKLEGTLMKYDRYMNFLMKKAEEYKGDEVVKKHDLVVVKGGNVKTVTR